MKRYLRIGPAYSEWRNLVVAATAQALIGWVDDQLLCVAIELGKKEVPLHFLFREKRTYHEDLVEAIQDGVENGLNFEVVVPTDVTYGVAIADWEFADLPRLFLRYGVARTA